MLGNKLIFENFVQIIPNILGKQVKTVTKNVSKSHLTFKVIKRLINVRLFL